MPKVPKSEGQGSIAGAEDHRPGKRLEITPAVGTSKME
jgi:hypothetical protein